MFLVFIKNDDNTFALILWYGSYQRMHIVRLAGIVAARKRSRKGSLRCTSCHCMVPRGQLGFGRSYTPILR